MFRSIYKKNIYIGIHIIYQHSLIFFNIVQCRNYIYLSLLREFRNSIRFMFFISLLAFIVPFFRSSMIIASFPSVILPQVASFFRQTISVFWFHFSIPRTCLMVFLSHISILSNVTPILCWYLLTRFTIAFAMVIMLWRLFLQIHLIFLILQNNYLIWSTFPLLFLFMKVPRYSNRLVTCIHSILFLDFN